MVARLAHRADQKPVLERELVQEALVIGWETELELATVRVVVLALMANLVQPVRSRAVASQAAAPVANPVVVAAALPKRELAVVVASQLEAVAASQVAALPKTKRVIAPDRLNLVVVLKVEAAAETRRRAATEAVKALVAKEPIAVVLAAAKPKPATNAKAAAVEINLQTKGKKTDGMLRVKSTRIHHALTM
jgi:hypothetical protein